MNLGVAASVLMLQRDRIKTRVFSYFCVFKMIKTPFIDVLRDFGTFCLVFCTIRLEIGSLEPFYTSEG